MSQRERLGKYEIIEVLGKGAMGVVFKGFDPGIARTVAIKTVRKELIEDDGRAGMALARFRNEARAAGRLSHPGIVAVYDYGESEEVTYIAMEFVQGSSLREYFNRGTRFAEPDVVSIMAQLLEALQHAHDAGVWHRDIKPANLIIMNNGRLKIADFGIARIEATQLTQTGVVMGSPGYMAPEQYAGGTIDWRADLFAASVVMHQLLTGERLYAGTAEQVAYKICHLPPPPPSQAAPGRGWERYDATVLRALAKKPGERFQSAAAFREALLKDYAAPVNAAVSEETIILESAKPAGVFEPSNPSARTGERSSSAPPPIAPIGTGSGGVASAASMPAPKRIDWRLGAGIAAAVLVGVALGGWLVARGPAELAAPARQAAASPPAAKPEAPPAPPPRATPPAPVPKVEPAARVVEKKPARKVEQPKRAASRPSAPAARRERAVATPSQPAPAARTAEPRREERIEVARAAPAPAPSPTPAPAAEPTEAPAAPSAPPAPSVWRDQGITMKVASRVQFNRRLWSYGIQVETVAGIVTLKGTVQTQAEFSEAQKLAASVAGVLAVKNEIKISP
jgi:serine/threonine protein kinase